MNTKQNSQPIIFNEKELKEIYGRWNVEWNNKQRRLFAGYMFQKLRGSRTPVEWYSYVLENRDFQDLVGFTSYVLNYHIKHYES